MKSNDKQLGLPQTVFIGTTTELNAVSGVVGMVAYNTSLNSLVIYTSSGWVAYNPMTAQGDIVYGGPIGIPTKLVAGAPGTVLRGGSTPYWGYTEDDSGWVYLQPYTWSYVSPTSVIVSGDVSGKIRTGDKILLYQVSKGYYTFFYVISVTYSSPNTTIVLKGSTPSVTVANEAIVDKAYSKAENPQYFPQNFNWTPLFVSSGGSITSYTINNATFVLRQKHVTAWCDITITNNGTGSGAIVVGVPIDVSAAWPFGAGRETAVAGTPLTISYNSATNIAIYRTDTGGYPGGTNWRLVFGFEYMI